MEITPEYELLTEDSTDTTQTCPIKIKSGQYKGIVYRYGQISFNEVEDGHLAVNMQIELIKAPEGFDKNTEHFTKTLGEIFVDIVESKDIQSSSSIDKDMEDDVHQDPVDKP